MIIIFIKNLYSSIFDFPIIFDSENEFNYWKEEHKDETFYIELF